MAGGNTTTTTSTAVTSSSSGQQCVSACPPTRGGLDSQMLAVGIPTTAVWALAVWAKGRYAWGLASGLWVGLFCACVTLKMTSFASVVGVCPAASTPTEATAVTPLEGDGNISNGGSAATATTNATTTASTAAAAAAATTSALLTFGEFLFFMFLSPSLVCEVHLMKASARRPGRPLRAASEWFHALLAFLASHCMVGSILAPSLRVFVAGFRPGWVEGAATVWAELDSAAAGGAGGGGGGGVSGGGGWPSWATASGLLEGDNGAWVTAAAFLWILTIVSSCLNFLVFYAFWHCVCLGMAELWGFPDRHLYGCWWLVFDDPRQFLRMWSVPVHRWLSACVYWPMLEAEAAAAVAAAAGVGVPFLMEENGNGGNGDAEGDGGNGADVGKDADKPSSSSSSASSSEKEKKERKGGLSAVLATFIVSAVFHEAVVYVAMRGTVWPFNTFLLTVAASLVMAWDNVFPPPPPPPQLKKHDHPRPVLSAVPSSDGRGGSGSRRGGDDPVATAETESAGGSRPVEVYRGRGVAAVLAFGVLTQLSVSICDVAAWLWWRSALMT